MSHVTESLLQKNIGVKVAFLKKSLILRGEFKTKTSLRIQTAEIMR